MPRRDYAPCPNTVAGSTIRSTMRPGTMLRHKKTGKLYMLGEPWGMGSFWLMQMEPPAKGTERATTVLRDFEVADAAV